MDRALGTLSAGTDPGTGRSLIGFLMTAWVEEHGVVVAIDGEWASVRVQRRSTCGACSARTACGSGVLAEVLGRRALELRIAATEGLEPGDRVVLGVRDDALVSGAVMMYLLPLAGLIGGGLVASVLLPGVAEVWVVVAAVFGFFAGLVVVRRWLAAREGRLRPVLLRRERGS